MMDLTQISRKAVAACEVFLRYSRATREGAIEAFNNHLADIPLNDLPRELQCELAIITADIELPKGGKGNFARAIDRICIFSASVHDRREELRCAIEDGDAQSAEKT